MTGMELQPASPSLIDSLRAGTSNELSFDTIDVRPQVQRVILNRAVPMAAVEEDLVPDQRAALTPAQSVERKLTVLLRGGTIPISHIRMAKLCRKV
jgi:hypothetical protein